jgi:hypothetical protein
VAIDFIVDYHLKDANPALSDKERRKILRDVLNGPATQPSMPTTRTKRPSTSIKRGRCR